MTAGALSLCVFLSAALGGVERPAQGASLERGVALVEEGRFDQAIEVLTQAGEELRASGAGPDRLARVYLYTGWAYVGLGKLEEAKARFMAALAEDGDVGLSEKEFPRKVREAFELARSESRQQRRSRWPWLVAAGGGAAAIAVGAASGGSEPCNPVRSVRVSVPASLRDIPTGAVLAAGQCFRVSASGAAQVDPDFSFNGPDGIGTPAANKPGETYPLPGSPFFGLVGRIGGAGYFFVGSSLERTADAPGELFLMINDPFEGLANNAGGFEVTVTF